MKRASSVIALGVLSVAALLLWARFSPQRGTAALRDGAFAPLANDGRDSVLRGIEPSGGTEFRHYADRDTQGRPDVRRPVEGVVLDGATHRPLVARVAFDSGTCVTGIDGRFRVSVEASGGPLTFRAEGYRTVERSVEGLVGASTVLLDPEIALHVTVVDSNGRPLADRSVEFSPLERALRGASTSVGVATTGADGVAHFPCGHGCVARLAGEGATSGVYVPAGGAATLVAGAGSWTLRLVDAHSGAALAGVRARVFRCGDSRLTAQIVESDPDGAIVLQSRAPGLEVEWLDGEVESAGALPAPLQPRDPKALHVPYVGDDTSARTIELRTTGAALRLRNAATGELYDGPARLALVIRSPELTPPPGAYERVRVRDGLLRLPLAIPLFAENPALRALLHVPGFEPCDVPDLDRLYAGDSPPREVEIVPCARRTLRLVRDSGQPYRLYLSVASLHPERELFRGRPRSYDGTLDVDWSGGDLLVSRPARRGDVVATGGRVELARVGAELLAASSEVEVVVRDVPLAAAEVTGVPFGRVIHALDRAGQRRTGLADEGGLARIEGLAPGRLLIGSADWVERNAYAFLLGAFPETVSAAPGEAVTLPYDAHWAGSKPIAGRIRLDPVTARHVRVLPEYTREAGAGRHVEEHFALRPEADGTYRIEAGAPVPRRLALWVPRQTDPALGSTEMLERVGWVDVGEDVSPPLGSVRISVGAEASEPVVCRWGTGGEGVRLLPGAEYDVPGRDVGTFELQWRRARGNDGREAIRVLRGEVSTVRVP